MPAELARKHPVMVEAFPFDGDNGAEIADWAGQYGSYNHFDGLRIDTPQGLMSIPKSDVVIHGPATSDYPDGHYYPVTEATYAELFDKVNGP